MRDILYTATICLALSACGNAPLAPVTYEDRVAVQSVLPVHIRLNAFELPEQSATTINFAGPRVTPDSPERDMENLFGTDDQATFVDSLKTELVRHGVFGSISENGGNGVVDLDIYFPETAYDSGTYRISVTMIARYRGQIALHRYEVTSRQSKSAAATNLLKQVMVDVQSFVDDQQISLRTGIKDTRLDLDRMLVKW